MNNPENSNPAVLGSMLEIYGGDSSEFYVAQIEQPSQGGPFTLFGIQSIPEYKLSEGYTYQDINNAWNSNKIVLIYLFDIQIAIRPFKNDDNDAFTFDYDGISFTITPENDVVTREATAVR